MLTIGERIILHLSQYARYREQYQCPVETTQNGISDAIGISRAHVAIELKRLKSGGELEEKAAHVDGAKTKRKVYFLTLKGEERSRDMRTFAKERKVWLLEPEKEKRLVNWETAIDRLKKAGIPETLAVELVLQFEEIEPAAHKARLKPEDRRRVAPPPVFFGRAEELDMLGKWLEGERKFMVVMGMSGIGKTTLAEKFSSELDREVFWHRVFESDSGASLLKALGAFLHQLGRRRLGSYVSSTINPEFKEVQGILKTDLEDVLVVVDDCHRSGDVERLLSCIKESDLDAKVLVTSNKKPGCYNRSDVVVGKTVEEMFLRGMDEDAARELLKVRGFNFAPPSFKKLFGLTKGHPTALLLMASKDYESSYKDFLRYLNEELLGDLRSDEEQMLRKLSVLRGPFSHGFVKESETITLHRLMRKSLVQDMGVQLVVPELVADYFYNNLEREERKESHSRVADHFLRENEPFERLYHLVKAGREFEAVQLALAEKEKLLSRPKEFNELIQNLRPRDRHAPNFNLLRKTLAKRLEGPG